MKRIVWTVVMGAMLAVGAGCAEAPEVAGLVADADGVSGTLWIGGERIEVAARRAGDVVQVEVAGYAELERDLGANAISGQLGGQWFGRAEDAATDLDAARWAAIAHARTGEVLRAVSEAAAPLVDAEERDAAAVTLAKLSPMLASLALEGAEGETPPELGACKAKGIRISITGGTAYLAISTCTGSTARNASVVNECATSSVSWRVRSYATGGVLNAGSKASCVGGGAGTFYQKVLLEGRNRYGYWEGFPSP